MNLCKKIKSLFQKPKGTTIDMIRQVLAILIFLTGIVLGFYYGVIVMFTYGIVNIVTAIAADPILTGQLTVGILKFALSEVVGFGIVLAGGIIATIVGEK